MYLRTTKRKNADGSEVAYYQLAENAWDPERGCAVAKVIHNFGRSDQLDGETLRRLAKSILRVFPADEQVAALQDVKVLDSRSYGGAYVLEHLWRELEIDKAIAAATREAHSKQPFERALFAMVANRALVPYSKLHCHEQWLAKDVFISGTEELKLHHLYRAMDLLETAKEKIEKAVYFKMADIMKADVDLIFYDTTSLHFEVDEEDEVEQSTKGLGTEKKSYPALRKRGHSKNGRGDAPQIVIGLAVTRDGLPVRSWVFSGETADITTVEKVKEDLRGWKLGRCVFVGDAGMNSEENRQKLALGNGKYILATRMKAGDEVTKEVLTRAGRYQELRDNLRVKEVVVGDGEARRRYVVCHNPDEEKRQRLHREKLLEQVGAEIEAMREPAAGTRHKKRTCELLTSRRFGRYLRETKKGALKIDRAAVEREARYDGKWVVTSNDDTLTAEDLALGYKQLARVEECWRTMKSGLDLRPVCHWRPWRIRAHVGIAVLGLLLERVAELRAGDTWRNLSDRLEGIKVVDYERGAVRVRQTTELRPEAASVLKKLGIAEPPRLHAVAAAAKVA